MVFLVGGVCSVLTTGLVGRIADKHGRHRTFYVLALVALVVTLLLSNLGPAPLWQVLSLAINQADPALLFAVSRPLRRPARARDFATRSPSNSTPTALQPWLFAAAITIRPSPLPRS